MKEIDGWAAKESKWVDGMERQAAEENFVFLCGRQWNGVNERGTKQRPPLRGKPTTQPTFLCSTREEKWLCWRRERNEKTLSFWMERWAALLLFHCWVMGCRPSCSGGIPFQTTSLFSISSFSPLLVLLLSLSLWMQPNSFCFSFFNQQFNWWMKEMEWKTAARQTYNQPLRPPFLEEKWREEPAATNHSIHSFINKSKFNNFHFYLIDSFHFDGMKRLNKNVL